ncbi:MAG: Hpt domain-containing protein [Xanthomonadaceae bacterium]|nr:Hpt domain-containing protein [Xanthomonadaceae bacterium]
MRLDEDIDFTTLTWVKGELDETLKQARQALEVYVEDPADASQMRFCATYLHQVQGTLRMVELYGAAMVIEDMEQLAQALLDGRVRQPDEAYAALMRGMVQMPDYLERLQSGHRDIPIVLLPLINDLRACRGEKLVSEAMLFTPELNTPLPADAPGAAAAQAPAAQQRALTALRSRFQAPLLAWFRNQGSAPAHLATMRQVLDAVGAECYSVPGRRLWWITAGVVEGLEQGLLEEHSVAVKQLIGRVDRCMRTLIEQGEVALARGEAEELARSLLYYVAQAKPGSVRLDLIRHTYRLDRLLPSQRELEHARGAMAGQNRALLDTVAKAIKEDLLRVKDALDLFLRNAGGDPAQLGGQADVLGRVADTLGMLGLGVPRRVVNEQRQIVNEIAGHARAADESTLLDVAGALLYVEASLDDHIDRLGAEDTDEVPAALPKAEARRILEALTHEAVINLGKVKDDIVAFIESPWDHARVEQIPALLEEIGGALRMLDLQRPAELLAGIARFVHNELVADHRIPTAEQMDLLADALTSVEYYLEAAREQRPNRERILDVTERSLAALGHWPVPPLRQRDASAAPVAVSPTAGVRLPADAASMPAPVVPAADAVELTESVSIAAGSDLGDLVVGESGMPATHAADVAGLRLAETEATAPPAGDDGDWIEIEEEVEEQVQVGELTAPAGFQAAADEIDAEIREVFVDEVQEEISGLGASVPAWLAQVDHLDALKPIRRAFHTLKGSGRLVGALTLGEFAWKIENMLNRVLDHSIAPDLKVQALVQHAVAALPALLAALRGASDQQAPLAAIMQAADRLAAGEPASVEQFLQPTRFETVRRVIRRRVPRAPDAAALAAAVPGATLAGVGADDIAVVPFDHAVIELPQLPPVDAVLLEILRSEVVQHLSTVRDYLATCRTQPQPVSEPLLRAVHTLNGAIAMVDIPVIGHVLAPFESYLKRLRALEQAPAADGVQALADAATLIEQVMAQYDAATPVLPDSEPLAARVAALRDALPEPQLAHPVYELPSEDASGSAPEPPLPVAADEDELQSSQVPLDAAAAAAEDARVEAWLAEFTATSAVAPTVPAAAAGVDDDLTALLLASFESESRGAAASPEQAPVADAASPLPPEEDAARVASMADAAAESAAAAAEQEAALPVPETAAEESIAAEPGAFEDAAGDPERAAADIAPVSLTVSTPLPAFPEDAQPEGALDLPDLDADLLEIFVQEGTDILDHADGQIAGLRMAPHQREFVAGLQRDLHTLKGGARMAGLAPIGDLAHAMETLLEAVGEGRRMPEPLVIESLERGFDRLHEMVQRIAQHRAIAMPERAIERFETLAAGRGVAAGPAAPASAGIAARAAAAEPEAPAAERVPLRPLPPLEPEEIRAPQEMIRVRSDLLDSLVNYAGEVSIYRSRLEQQVATFRFNLVEFEQTVSRLREQLRKLEIETEAQIIARYQRENQETGSATFDPLELDRFSQLQQLSRALAESVSDLVSIQGLLDDITRQSETLLLQQSRVSSDLQEGLMRTRMVPFDALVPSLRRTLRQAAQELGKRAQLRVEGAHGEMDRNLLERMKAPFEHMLRNALAHGIETPAERLRAGKPEEGQVTIQVGREATEVVIRVSDDGHGFDRDAIRAKAIERGLLREDAQLSDRDLYAFVLETGFSTAETVTQLAGRGVGMDVVASEIKQLGGTLVIDSQRGRGTTFSIRLPFTLAVTQAILVKLGESVYALPMTSVQGVARIAREDLATRMLLDAPSFTYAGETYAIHDLGSLLGVGAGRVGDEPQLPLLMLRSGDQRAAVRIDAVVGSREIVVKSVGPQISSVPGIFGATIMGDGSVVMILDLAPLVRRSAALGQRVEVETVEELLELQLPEPSAEPRARPLVMVVDDSITMRKVTTRVLERNDLDVITAKDGLDAVEKLQERVPDLMLLDIEMPRMDGYEVATYMKNDPRLKRVPIVMITSRTGEKHRQRALEIGVERYLGKPYQEAELLRNVQELLEPRRV